MVEQYDIHINHHGTKTVARTQKEKKAKNSAWYVLGTVGQVGYSVALPLVIGALLGSYIDKRTGSYPRGTLIGLGIGFVFSVISFYHVIRDIMRESKSF